MRRTLHATFKNKTEIPLTYWLRAAPEHPIPWRADLTHEARVWGGGAAAVREQGLERGEGGDDDAARAAVGNELRLLVPEVLVDLVDLRLGQAGGRHRLELRDAEVRDAERAHQPAVPRARERAPRRGDLAIGLGISRIAALEIDAPILLAILV